MKLYNNKITISIILGFLSVFILLMPVLVAGGAVSAPIVAISSLFNAIGDFVFGGDNTNDVIELINKYLDNPDTKKEIKKIYQPMINKEKEIDVSLHWLLIPNLLAGVEDVNDELIKQQIAMIKEAEGDLESYINHLRKEEPYKTGLGTISTTTIVGYINIYNSYLGQEEDIDVGNLKEEEFLYPLKHRAIVTSNFGTRLPVKLPDGTIVKNKHKGTDLAYNGGDGTTCGVPVYAAMSGKVVANERTSNMSGANWGSIRYKNLDIWYLHLRDPFPYEVGTEVRKGQFVGYIGDTGLAAGCHLHFETHVDGKAVDARNFLDF